MNLGAVLTNAVEKYPDRFALIHLNQRWTFTELNNRVNRLANALKRNGVIKGDRIALMFYNSNQFVEVYFAAMKIGAVVTPVNFRFVGPEIDYILNDSGATTFFYGEDFHEVITSMRPKLKKVARFIAVNAPEASNVLDFEQFLDEADGDEPTVRVTEDDICQLMYTSGTTGRPKGAVLTHRSITWNMFNTIWGREDEAGEIALIIGPLYHTAALNNHLTVQIALGGTSILIKRFDPLEVLEVIETEKATTISGAPTMYHMLLQHADENRFDTSSITKCTVGSAILPGETKRQLEAFFPNIKGIYDVYGCTEASPTITILRGEDAKRKEGSVGKAMPYVQVRIVDEMDRPLPANEIGEVICRGPNIMIGYHGQEAATRETLRNGWFHTGDMAKMDEEGFVYIVDRKKDMINSGGENISPREVEEVLLTHPLIDEVAVVGVEDSVWGETVRAFIVCKEGESLSEDDVIAYCKQHLASYKKPKWVSFIDKIPKNPSGKILKTKLRQIPL